MSPRTSCGTLIAMALAGAIACREPEPVTLALVGGRIWTGDAGRPWAEAVAVSGDRIMAVGSSEEIRARAGADARMIELNGRLVVPGLGDSHTHFLSGGFVLLGLDLRYADTPEEFVRRIGEFASKLPAGRWITGGDWDHERWDGAPLPRRDWIDSVTPENPVFITRLDGHMGLANSLALREAGVTRETNEPEGGVIVRDRRTGEPTGILKDAAMPLVTSRIPPPSEKEQDEALQAALTHAATQGVTSIHDVSVPWRDVEAYRRFRDRGALTVRVLAFPDIADWRRVAGEVAREGREDAWFRVQGVKGYVDGSLGSTTALFVAPYDQDPSTRGELVTPIDSMRRWIFDADSAGLHLAIHAIGDSANHLLLNLYQELIEARGASDRRLRVEHAQHLRPQDIPRFGQLGVLPSMQPYHAIDDGRWAEKRIGRRIRTTYAFRSLLDAGARLAFGSDWSVAPLSPIEGIYAAVTRRTLDAKNPDGWVPEEKITVEDALRAYTSGHAYAGFRESESGSIAPGKLADLVVLERDLFLIDPVEIQGVRVDVTVVGGKVVHDRRPAPQMAGRVPGRETAGGAGGAP